MLCRETTGVDIAQTLGIKAKNSMVHTDQATTEGEEDEIACVKWMGPGSLTLPPGGECCAICEVELRRPLGKELLMVEASPATPLPSGVFLQPMVLIWTCLITHKPSVPHLHAITRPSLKASSWETKTFPGDYTCLCRYANWHIS